MIELHYWPTPNGHKLTIFLEEAEVPYRIKPVNIMKGEQFEPAFLEIAPNNRMPALIDDTPIGGGAPLSLFESGAMLLYLGDKYGRFLPSDIHKRAAVLQWLFWQMGGLGPMLGQNHHFRGLAEPVPYALTRYTNETNRLYGVLDRQLAERDYIAGDYSIADMACYPWIVSWERQGQTLSDFPNVLRWFETIAARPAVIKAYAIGEAVRAADSGEPTDAQKAMLFNQTAATIARP